jgi:hypothetical protein
MAFCNSCGAENPDDVKFCSNCGAALKSISDETAAIFEMNRKREIPAEPKKRGFLNLIGWAIKWMIISVVSLFILAIFVGFFFGSSDPDKPGQTSEITLTIDEIKEKSIIVSYDELMRHNENYIGEIVHYEVEVVQVHEKWGEDEYILLCKVSSNDPYDFSMDNFYIDYEGERLLEDDLIEIWATVDGLKTYTTVLGAKKTVPELTAKHVELIRKGG